MTAIPHSIPTAVTHHLPSAMPTQSLRAPSRQLLLVNHLFSQLACLLQGKIKDSNILQGRIKTQITWPPGLCEPTILHNFIQSSCLDS